MLFTSLTFFVFAAIFFPLYFNTRGRGRLLVILVSSYIFYGWWDWRFLALIAFSTFMDWYFGKNIDESDDPKRRKMFLVASMVMNLGFLSIFKYFNFFADGFVSMLSSMGLTTSWTTLKILLPAGISFYTFQSMSYTIDVYRREIPREKDMLKFAAFIALFPQLVAGPIVRARDLLPQMATDKKFDWNRFHSGIGRILWGFFKKICVADSIAPFVDQVFQAPETFGSMHLLIGCIFYAFQIYCDFSGYSDIAIGLARMMGFDFPENFRTPYFSKSFSEFWTHWHISLSGWLRDYLYIPLGGNRGGTFSTYKNNMLTMLLGGLWHGANLAFVFWGFLHGLFLILQRQVTPVWRLVVKTLRMPKFLDDAIAVSTVFSLTLFAWIYFRAGSVGLAGGDSFGTANKILSGIFSGEGFSFAAVINKFQVTKGAFLIALLLAVEVLKPYVKWNTRQVEQPIFRIVLFSAVLLILALFGVFGGTSFIYFQF